MFTLHLSGVFRRFWKTENNHEKIECYGYHTSDDHILDPPLGEESTDRWSYEKCESESRTDKSHIFRLFWRLGDIGYVCLDDSESRTTESWDKSSSDKNHKEDTRLEGKHIFRKTQKEDAIADEIESWSEDEEIFSPVPIRKSPEYESSEKHPDRIDSLRIWIPVFWDGEISDDIRKYGNEYADAEYVEECRREYEEHEW